MMLKASPEAAIRARFEGEVAERKTVPRLFSAFGVNRPIWAILHSQTICRSAQEYGPLGGGELIDHQFRQTGRRHPVGMAIYKFRAGLAQRTCG